MNSTIGYLLSNSCRLQNRTSAETALLKLCQNVDQGQYGAGLLIEVEDMYAILNDKTNQGNHKIFSFIKQDPYYLLGNGGRISVFRSDS